MDKILGAQKLKFCEPHGLTDTIVVMYDGDYIICHDIDAKPPFDYFMIKDGPKDYGYVFHNLQRQKYLNINWDTNLIQNIKKESINKISLCYFPGDCTPLILQLLDIEYTDVGKIVKVLFMEQVFYDFEKKEYIFLEKHNSTIKFIKEGRHYILEDIID